MSAMLSSGAAGSSSTPPQINNNNKYTKKRNSTAVIGVEAFASQKGSVKALQSYRERQDRKRVHKAKALRSYHKAVQREGYAPPSGRSRRNKRRNEHTDETEEREGENAKDTHTQSVTKDLNDVELLGANGAAAFSEPVSTALGVESSKHKKHHKSNPLKKSLEKARQAKDQKEQARIHFEQQERTKRQKLRERRQRTQLLSRRTAKGQPIMKNIVQDILHKLEHKAGEKK